MLLRELAYRPLVLAAVGVIAGIALAEALRLTFSWLLLAAAVVLAGLVWAGARRLGGERLALLGAGLALGALLHSLSFLHPAHHLSHWPPLERAELVGRLREPPQQYPWGVRLTVEAEQLLLLEGAQAASGGVMVYYRGPRVPLRVGDRLHLPVSGLQPPPAALNPGQFDARRFWARRGVYAQGRAEQVTVLSRAERPAGSDLIAAAQQRSLRRLEQAMPGPEPERAAALLAGRVLGRRAVGGLDPAQEDLFRRTGTVHLLVVSGLQISFLLLVLVALITGLGQRALTVPQLLLVGPPLVAFALLAGMGDSVLRALVMAAVLAYALVSHRRYDAYSALALAALVLALADTQTVFEAGYQLSFLATLGVVLFYPRRRQDSPLGTARRRWGVAALWATAGSWALTAPIIANLGTGLPLLGNLANLFAIPLAMAALPVGLVALLTAGWLPPVAALLCALGRLLMEGVVLVNRLFAALPGAYLDLVYFSPAQTVAWYVVVGGGLLLVTQPGLRASLRRLLARQHRDFLFLAGAGLAALVAVGVVWSVTAPPRLRVDVLAVGEGQCALIRGPGGQAVLMDAGGYTAAGGERLADEVILPFLATQGVRRLSVVLVSHPDADHCNALPRLLERVPVGSLLEPGLARDGEVYAQVQTAARRRGLAVLTARAGQRFDLGRGAEALVISPSEPLLEGTGADLNNNSAGLLLRYGRTALLLPADLQTEGVERLLSWAGRWQVPLGAQVLILPHHGRRAADGQRLAEAVQPQWLLVSGARKPEGQVGEELVVTAERGAIRLSSDGQNWALRTHLPAERSHRAR